MAVYFNNKIPVAGPIEHTWSQADGHQARLAVPFGHNAVAIYTQEGQPLDPNREGTITNIRASPASRVSWHPWQPLLAIGWKDGAKLGKRRLNEDSKIHRSRVTLLQWSADGSRLITADETGKLGVWKVDSNMKPVNVISYNTESEVTHACYGVPTAAAEGESESNVIYFSTKEADKTQLWCADDRGRRTGLYMIDGDLLALYFYAKKSELIGVTTQANLVIHTKDEDGKWGMHLKNKLASGAGEGQSTLKVCLAAGHYLTSASEKDCFIRIFDLDSEDNYILSAVAESAVNTLKISSLRWSDKSGMLAAGTKDGLLCCFKYVGDKDGDGAEDHDVHQEEAWEQMPSVPVDTTQPCSIIEWGPSPSVLSVSNAEAIVVMKRTLLAARLRGNIAAVQLSQCEVSVSLADGQGESTVVRTEIQLSGLDASETHLMLWNGQRAEVYEIGAGGSGVSQGASFACESRSMALHRDSIFKCGSRKVEVMNLAGTVKQTLELEENQGDPVCLDVGGDYLAALTSNKYVRLWKLGGREAKPWQGRGRYLDVHGEPLGEIESIRCNCNGTKVSIIANLVENKTLRDPRLFVYDTDTDMVTFYDFRNDKCTPEGHVWDGEDPRLVACETMAMGGKSNDITAPKAGDNIYDIATLFATPNDGILLQEFHHPKPHQGLLGLHTPFLYYLLKPDSSQDREGASKYVERSTMRDFQGLEDVDDKTRKALIDFSFHLAVGKMDEAYKALKLIKTPSVWENMAQICIKTKRLDVAEHCLGNMQHARGARAVREAAALEELDARVATVAIHLGMVEDATKLFVSCERYDLLNRLYQACGQWDKALEVAEKYDRIHLRATHFSYAKQLELLRDYKGAIKEFELSNTHQDEVPRMMYETNQIDELEQYIQSADDSSLTKWWARYHESLGEYDNARKFYEAAGDYLAVVRLLCFQGDLGGARSLVDDSGDPAAAFHLGRQMEAQGNLKDAVMYYSRSKRFSHAVRVARKHNMVRELMNLALQSTPRVMIDTANYYVALGEYGKAVQLYQRGGRQSKALEICFKGELFEELDLIAEELDTNSDPMLLQRCADFFMDHQQHERASHLLVLSKQYFRALELCEQYDIPVSEEMAEAMTPEKTATNADERAKLLLRIARCAKNQGQYHLACKKYTQAGDKIKAMKALLKSGDTEKIVFFVNVSRQREIYMMGANYLQTLDWHNNPDVMKNIIAFYTKAKATDSLASFYEACAQIEIDEYRDYDKAIQAMKEALKYQQKSRNLDKDMKVASLNQRITLADKFSEARKTMATNPVAAVSVCEELLAEVPDEMDASEASIRIGDVFAMLVEYHHGQRNFERAYQLVEKMRVRRIILSPYLDSQMVAEIYRAMGLSSTPMDAEQDNGIEEDDIPFDEEEDVDDD
eukprot:CAMPEP_0117694304 /NCGR_PEP_ID=MMETSP0804-20121206/27375_1 /TAXON_ID=1074897 /ORGANISM="Tetraselmis astigmatica, Strain CCMP880" /LENGTH=1395 /DNA_ID=CAMNT_0005507981 /DNA_START=130 /DNA_END=4318 /DNA_ORIENTATION=+